MPKYINADKILSHLTDEIEVCGNPDVNNEPIAYGTKLGLLSAKAFIETAETVDVQEVRHGKWLPIKAWIDDDYGIESNNERYQTGWKCSLCSRIELIKEPYCHCGAKMDESAPDTNVGNG